MPTPESAAASANAKKLLIDLAQQMGYDLQEVPPATDVAGAPQAPSEGTSQKGEDIGERMGLYAGTMGAKESTDDLVSNLVKKLAARRATGIPAVDRSWLHGLYLISDEEEREAAYQQILLVNKDLFKSSPISRLFTVGTPESEHAEIKVEADMKMPKAEDTEDDYDALALCEKHPDVTASTFGEALVNFLHQWEAAERCDWCDPNPLDAFFDGDLSDELGSRMMRVGVEMAYTGLFPVQEQEEIVRSNENTARRLDEAYQRGRELEERLALVKADRDQARQSAEEAREQARALRRRLQAPVSGNVGELQAALANIEKAKPVPSLNLASREGLRINPNNGTVHVAHCGHADRRWPVVPSLTAEPGEVIKTCLVCKPDIG